MAKLSREKGKVFERKIAADLRAAFPAATVRRSTQAHRAYEPDVVVEGDAPEIVRRLWLECTSGAAVSPERKMLQAERDVRMAAGLEGAGERLPVVVWHRKGSRAVNATLRLAHLEVVTGREASRILGPLVTLSWDALLANMGFVVKEAA